MFKMKDNTSPRPSLTLQGPLEACTVQLTTTSAQEKEAVDRSAQADSSEEALLAGEGKGEGAAGSGDGDGSEDGDGSGDGEGSGARGRQMPHEVWHWVRV